MTIDGITIEHQRPRRNARHASLLSALILGSLMLGGVTGLLGGGKNTTVETANDHVSLRVNTPTVLRNGQFFETRMSVAARRPIGDLVVAIEPALWRDFTINSMIPAASEESFERAMFRFSYGPLARGEQLEIKIDSQINPALFGGTAGAVTIMDDDVVIARLPLSIRVLP